RGSSRRWSDALRLQAARRRRHQIERPRTDALRRPGYLRLRDRVATRHSERSPRSEESLFAVSDSFPPASVSPLAQAWKHSPPRRLLRAARCRIFKPHVRLAFLSSISHGYRLVCVGDFHGDALRLGSSQKTHAAEESRCTTLEQIRLWPRRRAS